MSPIAIILLVVAAKRRCLGDVDIGTDVSGRRHSNDLASGEKDPLALVREAYGAE